MSNNRDKIKNKALIKVEICGKRHIVESNEVEAKKIKIKLKKEQSCGFVLEGETIEYTLKIFNESGCNLYGVELIDNFSPDTKYKRDSFKVNGAHKTPEVHGHTLKYTIPEISDDEELIIKFDVTVE